MEKMFASDISDEESTPKMEKELYFLQVFYILSLKCYISYTTYIMYLMSMIIYNNFTLE